MNCGFCDKPLADDVTWHRGCVDMAVKVQQRFRKHCSDAIGHDLNREQWTRLWDIMWNLSDEYEFAVMMLEVEAGDDR